MASSNRPPRLDVYYPPDSEITRIRRIRQSAPNNGATALLNRAAQEARQLRIERHVWRTLNPGWIHPTRALQPGEPQPAVPPHFNPFVHLANPRPTPNQNQALSFSNGTQSVAPQARYAAPPQQPRNDVRRQQPRNTATRRQHRNAASRQQYRNFIPRQQYRSTALQQQSRNAAPRQQPQYATPSQQFQYAVPSQQAQYTASRQRPQYLAPRQQPQYTVPRQQPQYAAPQQPQYAAPPQQSHYTAPQQQLRNVAPPPQSQSATAPQQSQFLVSPHERGARPLQSHATTATGKGQQTLWPWLDNVNAGRSALPARQGHNQNAIPAPNVFDTAPPPLVVGNQNHTGTPTSTSAQIQQPPQSQQLSAAAMVEATGINSNAAESDTVRESTGGEDVHGDTMVWTPSLPSPPSPPSGLHNHRPATSISPARSPYVRARALAYSAPPPSSREWANEGDESGSHDEPDFADPALRDTRR